LLPSMLVSSFRDQHRAARVHGVDIVDDGAHAADAALGQILHVAEGALGPLDQAIGGELVAAHVLAISSAVEAM